MKSSVRALPLLVLGLLLLAGPTRAPAAEPATPKKVAVLVFDNVQIIDFAGPSEIFGMAGFDVYTVAATRDPVTTVFGLTVVPKYTFADAPQPDVLVVPGGGVKGPLGSAATLQWIRKATAGAEHTLSVCNGAFILARTGLLDGLTATTTTPLIRGLGARFPRVKVVSDQRFVDNGKIITAAGLSSGIDGALHVVARMMGEGRAQQVALEDEYDWQPESGFARAALADLLIPDILVPEWDGWDIVRTEGDRDRWEIDSSGQSRLTAAEILDRIGMQLAGNGWTREKIAAGNTASAGAASEWAFLGRAGEPWKGSVTVAPDSGTSDEYTARIRIRRAGSPEAQSCPETLRHAG